MSEERKKKPCMPVPDELTIQLSKSITLRGTEETVITEISLHEPNVSQLSQFIKKTQKENAVDAMKYLISLVSGLPMPVLDQIGVRDFYAAQDYMILFITPPDEDDPEGNAVASR
ncbi:phage tail assembly protein [Paraburkholderia sediminicola]|uniref:phage tail assembly protein n=1 Tax=Paraburkholderia sediminicola TaxID=458836 RepID=UPI0038B73DB9